MLERAETIVKHAVADVQFVIFKLAPSHLILSQVDITQPAVPGLDAFLEGGDQFVGNGLELQGQLITVIRRPLPRGRIVAVTACQSLDLGQLPLIRILSSEHVVHGLHAFKAETVVDLMPVV